LHLLALALGKTLHIGAGFGHKILVELDPIFVSDIWSTMCAYDGWACSIEMDAFTREVLDRVREVFSVKSAIIYQLCPYSTFGPAPIFLPFKISYFLIPNPTHKHELGTLKDQNTLIINQLDQSIHLPNQDQPGIRLRYGFYQRQHIEQKCSSRQPFNLTCWTNLYWFSSKICYAVCGWRCCKSLPKEQHVFIIDLYWNYWSGALSYCQNMLQPAFQWLYNLNSVKGFW
jgi:hypothetical protein